MGAASHMWHFYIRKGMAYLPTIARTEAGFFLDIEPVVVLQADRRGDLIRALGQSIASGNVSALTPKRGAYGTPAILKAASIKTWATFERGARCYTVYRTDSGYEIPTMEHRAEGWVENAEKTKRLPLSSHPDDVARVLVDDACASQGG